MTSCTPRRPMAAASMALVAVWLVACANEGGAPVVTPEGAAGMDGDTARCTYSVLTFALPGGERVEVDVNGLPVEELSGAAKVGPDEVEVVRRRGVRFDAILSRGGVELPDDLPVNCVARDGWDPLRTRLRGDTAALPELQFLRRHGYVYLGFPGDKDPLYPELEGLSLCVDYDLGADGEVPPSLGGTLRALAVFRWLMVERYDEDVRGVIEIDPEP